MLGDREREGEREGKRARERENILTNAVAWDQNVSQP